MHEEKNNERKTKDPVKEGADPVYLMEREGVSRAKVISSTNLDVFVALFFGGLKVNFHEKVVNIKST